MANGSISQFAVVTGASSGIGLELARQFAQHGFDLLICAENAEIKKAADELRREGHRVDTLRVDLGTYDGVERLCDTIRRDSRWVDAIAINAGVGSSGPFLETDLAKELKVIQLSVAAVVHLTKRILPGMRVRNEGRILVTSSIAAGSPGPFEAVYAASKAFVQSFAVALRNELKDTNITIFAIDSGMDPAAVARQGFEALMKGRDRVVSAKPKEKLMAAAAKVAPEKAAAEQRRKQAEPGSASP